MEKVQREFDEFWEKVKESFHEELQSYWKRIEDQQQETFDEELKKIEREREKLKDFKKELEKTYDKLNKVSASAKERIKLNVGGRQFQTSIKTITMENSLFTAMFSGSSPIKPDKDGEYFIDRDPKHFDFILNYLRKGNADLEGYSSREVKEILDEVEFFEMQNLQQLILFKLDEMSKKNSTDSYSSASSSPVSAPMLSRDPIKLLMATSTDHMLPMLQTNLPQEESPLGSDLSWMLDPYGERGFPALPCNEKIRLAFSSETSFDENKDYECPPGYHWATSEEYLKLLPQTYDTIQLINIMENVKQNFGNIERDAFMFKDTATTKKWLYSRSRDLGFFYNTAVKSNRVTSSNAYTFAGIVCVADEPKPQAENENVSSNLYT